jgi:autotransporter strand-loop-strand O-heptosyltransferase
MKKTLVKIITHALGDSVAALPYVSRLQEENRDEEVYVNMADWLIPYFSPVYQNIKFTSSSLPEEFDRVINLDYDFNKPIQRGFAEQLGFSETPYIRPKILIPNGERPIKGKYISIGVHSTAQIKYWNHPAGKRVQGQSPYWNELCSLIRKEGYTPVVVERDELFGVSPFFNGLPNKSNKKWGQSLTESMNLIYHSDFYVGLSSGMSWVAHAMGKPVAMIANFTESWNEFDLSLEDYIRITNTSVCHGCWNLVNKDFKFDKGDWYWCPRHKGTNRQFECHTSITPQQVFNEIKKWMK